jgi:hypothetical protein
VLTSVGGPVCDEDATVASQPLSPRVLREIDFFIDNLLVRIHLIIEMALVNRPCAIGV